jgi:hypothetical protein
MRDDNRQYAADREIRRLDQQADHLEYLGDYEGAAELRHDAVMLASAEAQRLHAISDARREVRLLRERLHQAWELLSPSDSFNWFLRYSSDPEVIELREHLERQQARLAILEAAQP